MAGGGHVQLPDGSVIVALSLPVPLRSVQDAGAAAGGPGRPGRPGGTGGAASARALAGSLAAPPSTWPWRQRSAPEEPPEPTGARRWSAHADRPRTVREAVRLGAEEPRVRVLVHAGNRARALTRLRNLGLRAVYLSGNMEPPTPDEITAVLHHPDGLVWRAIPLDDTESWQPIGTLLRPHRPVSTG